jgi:predicted transcriptional regulator
VLTFALRGLALPCVNNLTFRITDELDDALQAAANRRGVKRSAVLREWIALGAEVSKRREAAVAEALKKVKAKEEDEVLL